MYCIDKDIDFPVRNQAFAIYTQKLQEAIKNHKASNGGKIAPKDEQTLQNMLISESAIKEYIGSAEQIISDIKQTAIDPYRNKFNWGDFWVSVGSSVLGAFIFSVLLVSLVFIAEEQVKSIVAPLVYEQKKEVKQNNLNKVIQSDFGEQSPLLQKDAKERPAHQSQ
jgi:hypothetical protein